MDKKQTRLRRARQARAKILELRVSRLSVHRTNLHIYATISDPVAGKVLVSASTLEAEVRSELAAKTGKGGNAQAAAIVGRRVAEKAKAAGISAVAFEDRKSVV